MMQVACATDATYLPHAAAMLHSLLSRHPGATAHVLHGPDLATGPIDELQAMCRRLGGHLRPYVIDDAVVAGLPAMGRISRVMWYRLYLPDLLHGLDRVLYVDCDVVVMNDLRPLWETSLGDALVGAVSNVFERGFEHRARELGLAGPSHYFNSGVLLMDLKAWRRERTAQHVLAIARERARELAWPDQDALNMALTGRWRALHPRWNCQNSLFYFAHAADTFGPDRVREAIRDPGLLHFEGGALAKPWHYLCKHPFRAEYHRHRAGTPWPAVAPEGRTLLHMLMRPLPTTWTLRVLKRLQRVRAVTRRGVPSGATS